MKLVTESFQNSKVVTEMTFAGDIANIALALHNEKTIRSAILAKYPTSDLLREKLVSIGTPKALKLAKKIPPGMNAREYAGFINTHFAGRTFWRWLFVVLGQEFSLGYQTLKAMNMSNNPDEHIVAKVF